MGDLLHSDTEYHTLIQEEAVNAFIAVAFTVDSPFLHLSFVLFISILLKWIPKYLRLCVHSMTSPLKETAGIACPTALLLRVRYRACTLLGLVSDSVFWHHCDTFDSSDC